MPGVFFVTLSFSGCLLWLFMNLALIAENIILCGTHKRHHPFLEQRMSDDYKNIDPRTRNNFFNTGISSLLPKNTSLARNLGICIFSWFIVACGSSPDPSELNRQSERNRPPTVEAVQTISGTLPEKERLNGTVRARNQTQIVARVSGPIIAVLANDGDYVAKGDPLIRIRDTEYRERLNQAIAGEQIAAARVKQTEAVLFRLETQLRRISTLSDRGLASALELESAQADVLSAQADLEMNQAQQRQAEAFVSEQRNSLNNTVVRAPIDGIVGARSAEVGQQVSINTPLFTIGDPKEMRVRVVLTERMLNKISSNTRVIITSEAMPSLNQEAAISRVLPFLNPITHTTQAEIDVLQPEGGLRPGMFVTVDLIYGNSSEATLVPNSALYQHPRLGRQGVYVVDNADQTEVIPDEDSNRTLEVGLNQLASVRFVPIEVVTEGQLMSGIKGVDPDVWVVTMGQYLLANQDQDSAMVQATDWEHIMQMQQIQNRDLLQTILNKTAARNTHDLETDNP